ncbi:MAG: hypothetical protein K2K55_05515 [Duncaniella sp.]|nr:hypothetical protein [Duncaniella sp.]
MKKTLVTLSIMFGMALAAQAGLMTGRNQLINPMADRSQFQAAVLTPDARPSKAPAKEESQDEQFVTYSFAGEPATALGLNEVKAGDLVAQMMQMTPATSSLYAGNKITKFQFYTGIRNNSNQNFVTEYTFFIRENLTAEPVYTQAFTAVTTPWELQTIVLDTPFTIEPAKNYYLGVYGKLVSTSDFTIVVDGVENVDEGAFIGMFTGGKWSYMSLLGSGYGSNCIAAIIQGENLPQNLVSADDYDVIPSVVINTPFTIETLITNRGANPVNSIELTYKIGDKEAVATEITFAEPLVNNSTLIVKTPEITYDQEAINVPFSVSITKVNGVENDSPNKLINGTVNVLEMTFSKNVVVEEFTGTWCGWCPRGIVGLETMTEEHPDGSFIPVAVHVGSDPMKAKSWNEFLEVYWDGGAPGSVINRSFSSDPAYQNLAMYYDYLHSVPALAEITGITAQWQNTENKVMDVKVKSRYALDFSGNCPYSLQFAVLEDSVGPYNQTNNYAGGGYGPMGGWESKKGSVKTYYMDVARYLEGFPMIQGSVPSTIEKGKEYEYSYTLDTSGANIKKRDGKYLAVVVYIIDLTTGRVENVLRMPGSEIELPSGINEVVSDENAPVEYYTIQGVKVENPSNGLYIRRQGNKVDKIVL